MLGFVFDVDDTLYEQIVPFRDAYNKLFISRSYIV